MDTPRADRAAALLDAADLIERDGLHKGDYWPGRATQAPYEPGMPCCAMGAIAVASGATMPGGEFDTAEVIPAACDLGRYINRERSPATGMLLHHWNDAKDRTAGSVAATMRAAARGLLEHEAVA